MKISIDKLNIDPQKISRYLLNINHPDGGSKARLLIGFGFGLKNVSRLENAIFNQATANEVSKVTVTEFGEKYAVEGFIETPSNRLLMIRSIWVRGL